MTTQSNITGSNPHPFLTSKLEKRFEQIGCQENVKDPIVVAKFFNPSGFETWYATEYYPETRCIFCFVTGMYQDEWGYTSLDELQNTKISSEILIDDEYITMEINIERDLYFTEKPISECLKKDQR